MIFLTYVVELFFAVLIPISGAYAVHYYTKPGRR